MRRSSLKRRFFHRRRRWKTAGLVLAAAAAILGWSFFGGFRINQINCQIEGSACSPEVMAELEKYLGSNIFSVGGGEISRQLILSDRNISSANVRMGLPGNLRVSLVGRKAAAQITNSPDSEIAVSVDSGGVILQSGSRENLPLVIWKEISGWQVEKILPDHVRAAVELAVFLDENADFQPQVRISPLKEAMVLMKSGGRVLFSLEKDLPSQLRGLQVILYQATIGAGEEIDLRFDNPVVRKSVK